MNKNYILPPLVCGFGAAVLNTVPGVKSLGCCLIVPLAAVFSIVLEYRINKAILPMKLKSALLLGFLTGLFATFFSTFFETLLTFIARTNDFVEALPQFEIFLRQKNLDIMLNDTIAIFRRMAADIRTTGFSIFYSFGILASYFIINSVFGILGGIIGMSIINKRTKPQN